MSYHILLPKKKGNLILFQGLLNQLFYQLNISNIIFFINFIIISFLFYWQLKTSIHIILCSTLYFSIYSVFISTIGHIIFNMLYTGHKPYPTLLTAYHSQYCTHFTINTKEVLRVPLVLFRKLIYNSVFVIFTIS